MLLPEGFTQKYQRLLGDESVAFLASFNKTGYKGFRLNPLKSQPKQVNLDLTQPINYTQWGYFGSVNGRSVDHQAGYVYSQEPSAMYVGEVAAPRPGERVLDLCAAPGGKTTHLAGFMQQTGLLVSNEIMLKRARILAENVERFGCRNVVITNETPDHLAKHFPDYFDRILVDAPCSGEGMFRKDHSATQYWTPAYPAECAKRQREILTEAVKMLKPGGQLIYSTCTFSPEEDEQMMAWLVATYPEFSLVPIKRATGMVAGRPDWADGNPTLKNAVRLFPHLLAGEGHFIAKLQKAGRPEVIGVKRPRKKKRSKSTNQLSKEQLAVWQAFAQENLDGIGFNQLIVFGEQLYALPQPLKLDRLNVVRPGLHLGTFKAHRFEPAYALALALVPEQFKQRLTLTTSDYQRYVHGDTIPSELAGKQWLLLLYQGKTVGFGKLVNKTVKNFFPKGLRFVAD
ncbi:RsmF rRNA methyltransferase first C-terminal domain-containing protein [Loigolactobacillus iwatensis]|uniref:RsmF rRNA methyltransferase first C-terminal domain-containing protein n=1 Tax=Loigolactobacillus iwatensis TaxID=1267156 RepID=UPI000F7E26DF|nr:RsmF rRNA methyltransferase first C-terminal domain-containing protein [Loigolactobacillus iwatensis]